MSDDAVPDRCAVVHCRKEVSHRVEYGDLPSGDEALYYCENHTKWAKAEFHPKAVEPL